MCSGIEFRAVNSELGTYWYLALVVLPSHNIYFSSYFSILTARVLTAAGFGCRVVMLSSFYNKIF